MPEREMGMKKIFNIENLTINTCCPEQPTNCNAIITGIEVSEELTFTIKTTGSQGGHVRVAVYSASLNSYLYADWQVCGINEFVFLSVSKENFEAQDPQFIVQTSTDAGLTVCSESSVPLFNTSQVVEYTETGEIELVPELTPGVTCSGELTHTIIYNNGELFDSADLSIDEAGNGTLELGGLPLDDANGIILIAYYCDGILVAVLAVNLTLLMFDVRVLGTDVDCEDEVLTATFVLTNHGTNTIPSGTEFDYEFTTDPALTEVVGQVVSGTYTLLVNLAPTETITMSIEYENPDCLTGSDITLTITDVPTGYGNFNPATLTDDITYEYVAPPMGLRLGFKVDIANAPVADPTSVSDWNTFFDLPTNGTPFTSVIIAGLEAKLIGGGNLIVKDGAFSGSTAIDYVIDETGVLIEVGIGSFGAVNMSEFTANSMTDAGLQAYISATIAIFNATGLQKAAIQCFDSFGSTTFNAPNIETMGANCFINSTIAGAYVFNALLTTGDGCFWGAAQITALTMSILTNLGSTVGDNYVFILMTALTAVTVPTALATIDSGNPDGDLVYAVGALGATVTYV